MIRSKKELDFYIKADYMMRTGTFTRSLKQKLIEFIAPDYIFQYIKMSRKCSYYSNYPHGGRRFLAKMYKLKSHRLGLKLGFSISFDNIGYGLHIPHYGTIVVGGGNQIGKYAVLHTSTCITAGNKMIGNGFYLSTGAKVIRDITVGDYVSIGANSVLNSNCPDSCMVAGIPAHKVKDSEAWYIRDGAEYTRRVQECERLRSRQLNHSTKSHNMP